MSRFTPLVVEVIKRDWYKLVKDFMYNDKKLGTVVVRAEFETDFTSINYLRYLGLYILYALLAGHGYKASVIHDWAYRFGSLTRSDGLTVTLSRREADLIFMRALLDEGVPLPLAWVFYAGVRLFGWPTWWNYRRKYKRSGNE